MADKNSSKNNFIMQAGILAAAGIISRIIGLLYRGPLQSVIGNLGLGYYQSAYNYYTIILLISSYSIPSAISKAIAQKLGEKEYRNAHRLFHGAMIYVLVVGGIASLFLFFGAGLFVSGAAVTVLRTFAPTIFVYGILGVLRGYFQAHKSMAQTSVSQILEQIANAVVSVGAAYLLIQMFIGTMEVPADQAGQVMRATYGAVGSALGTGVGGGVIVNGKVIDGAHGAGGEIGHITVNRHETATCGCGKHGCLEQYSSATGVVRCMKKLLDENPDADCVLRGKDFEAKDVFDAARSGDALAAREVDEMTDTLGMALASIASTTDPEMFLIGGGVARAGDVLFDPLVEHFKTYAFKSCRETPIKAASLGNDAGIYGAVRLIVGE